MVSLDDKKGGEKPGSKKKFKFEWKKKDKKDKKDTVSLLDEIMWTQGDEDDNKLIYLDTCASRVLFLLPWKNHFDSMIKVDEQLGTANKGALLPARGIGRVGNEEVKWCPDLRKAMMSLGRVHSWVLSADFALDGLPILYSTVGDIRQIVLVGSYKDGMPCFDLGNTLKITRRRPGNSVAHVVDESSL